MAPELRSDAARSRIVQCAGADRVDGATDLGGTAPAAGDRERVVERDGVVLPRDDPAGESPRLALSARPPDTRTRVAVLPQLPQHAPRVAPAGPLPSLTIAPRRSRRWTPWQALCAALLQDAVKCASRPPKDLRHRVELQRRQDQRWLDGGPAPLDFPTVCAVLELEPTAVRRALRRR
jgi:hypothetical protein